MEVASSIFVNREKELRQVNEAVETLQDEQRLLRTPIIEFSGVQGIGKTTLLQQIKAMCDDKSLSCIMESAEQWISQDFERVESLVGKRPIAIILDSLDTVGNEQFQTLETRLSKLIGNSRLFVVLASRNVQRFERTRSIARKLTIYSLEPLKREYCFSYLSNFAHIIPSDAYDIIFDWTRGYPLAMTAMTEAIREKGLNPAQAQDQKKLIRILMEKVIVKNLLANVTSAEEQTRFQILLALLSIPRRFNLILMQDLIGQYTPQYKLESSLAYITLPPDINKVTSVLNWSLEHAGYCIDAPVRNLFLLQYKIEQPQQYIEIHKFLAEKNKSFVREVTGSDRIRYLREFFYHLAYSEESAQVQRILAQQVEQLAQAQQRDEHDLLQSFENFLQFYEEFRQDEELKEALGQQNTGFVLSLVYRNFIEISRQLPEKMRGTWLKEFFSLVTKSEVQQLKNDDFALIFEEGMRQIIKQVPRDDAIKLYNELIQDAGLKVSLAEQFESVRSRVLTDLLDEG
jgi:hypothetical protein